MPHPTIDNFNTWSLAPPATILVTSPPTNRASGPHAAICHDGDQRLPVLSLFIAPPYRYGSKTGLPVPTRFTRSDARPVRRVRYYRTITPEYQQLGAA